MDKKYGIFVICSAILFLVFVGDASAKTWYVDDDGSGADFTKIQEAIDAASPGDTVFVWNGTYYTDGGVSISKERITLQGEAANTTHIHGKWLANKVVNITATNVAVSGFTVTGTVASGAYGIYVSSADYCNISGNSLFDGDYGICLNNSNYSVISHNNASDRKYGIYLSSCDNCLVDRNIANSNIHVVFEGGGYGVYLEYSSNNMLMNNTANSNDAIGIYLEYSSNNMLMNNTASTNNNGIRLYNSNNNNMIANNIINLNIYDGIFLGPSSNNNSLINNTANLNGRFGYGGYGFFLEDNSNNNLMSNTANSNYIGIYLYSSSNNNSLINNTANSNRKHGIRLWSSCNNNLITGNTALNNDYGISLHSSKNSNLHNNTVSNNNYGIHLESTSTNNRITENIITNNDNGTHLHYSYDNIIYHNNFINNALQAYDYHGFNNWYNGPIIGGNYWSDHVCRGNPSDGTEPYTKIDTNAGAVDNYPFENPDGWVTPSPKIISYAPEAPINDTEGATRTFNITIDQIVNVSWQINGTEVQLNESVTEAAYTNMSVAEGTWNVTVVVSNAEGTDMQTWDWIVTKVTHGAPEITSYSPETPVYDIEGAIRTFNVTVNQTVNVSWQINGAKVQLNESVTEAAYTNMSAVEGIWNVTVVVSNAEGTDMQIWDWIVTKVTHGAPEITSYSPETPVYDIEGAIRTFNITVNQTVNVSWQINGTEVQLNESVTEAAYTNTSAAVGTWNVSAIVTNANGTDMPAWVWNVTLKENQPPVANFTYSPANPIVAQTMTFNASNSTDPDGNITKYEWGFGGDGNTTNTTEQNITYSYASAGTFTVTLTVTDDDGATNTTSRPLTVSGGLVFDTGTGTYPSIAGTHNGTIMPNVTIQVSKLYTYPCAGTGGHTEHVIIRNESGVKIAEADWKGYQVDGHNITFDDSFTLVANETYSYSIRTGSYPQIIHADSKTVAGGTITCTSFVDTNGNEYDAWIPAIRFGV